MTFTPMMLALVLGISAPAAAGDADTARQLITGRTAAIARGAVVERVYHAADGRMAIANGTGTGTSDGAAQTGTWWFDEDGHYCRRLDREPPSCYRPRFADGELAFDAVNGGNVLSVRRLSPGDAVGLPGDDAGTGCDCRLTAGKRP